MLWMWKEICLKWLLWMWKKSCLYTFWQFYTFNIFNVFESMELRLTLVLAVMLIRFMWNVRLYISSDYGITLTLVYNCCIFVQGNPALNYTSNAMCLQLPSSRDQQHLSATLSIQDNIIFCVCERVIVNPSIALLEVRCGLQITRCRSSTSIPVHIVSNEGNWVTVQLHGHDRCI